MKAIDFFDTAVMCNQIESLSIHATKATPFPSSFDFMLQGSGAYKKACEEHDAMPEVNFWLTLNTIHKNKYQQWFDSREKAEAAKKDFLERLKYADIL